RCGPLTTECCRDPYRFTGARASENERRQRTRASPSVAFSAPPATRRILDNRMTVVGKNIPHDLDQARAVPGVAGLFTYGDLHHNLVPIVRDVSRAESFLAGKPISHVRGGADYL